MSTPSPSGNGSGRATTFCGLPFPLCRAERLQSTTAEQGTIHTFTGSAQS